jgi:hypothetical protein
MLIYITRSEEGSISNTNLVPFQVIYKPWRIDGRDPERRGRLGSLSVTVPILSLSSMGSRLPKDPKIHARLPISGILAGRFPSAGYTKPPPLTFKAPSRVLQVRNREMQGAMTLFHQSRHIRTPSLGSAH